MAKIQITKSRDYELVVVIKEPGGLTPLNMTPTATAKFTLVQKKGNKKLIEKDMIRHGMPEDGKFLLQLTADETTLFPADYSLEEDGGIFMDSCRGHVAVDDLDSPLEEYKHIDVILPSVYITDLGE